MSQVSGQRPPHCDAPHGAPSAAPGPEAALEEGSLEEAAAPPMTQGNDSGAPQALDSTDLDVPIEAVTHVSNESPGTRRAEAAGGLAGAERMVNRFPAASPPRPPPPSPKSLDPKSRRVDFSRGQPQGNPLDCTPLVANSSGHPSELGGARRTGNGALGGPKAHRKLQTHPSLASQGSKKSKGSTKSAASQIPLQAQEDCCVHCILSCLFCEFLTLCNLVLDCATCGSCSSEDSCLCCCCCGSGECADCDLPCDLDCGILDACCESADCLEICMECCGLCFSS